MDGLDVVVRKLEVEALPWGGKQGFELVDDCLHAVIPDMFHEEFGGGWVAFQNDLMDPEKAFDLLGHIALIQHRQFLVELEL